MKNMMEYKGYYAPMGYGDGDECFFGTIPGIADVISFEGSNPAELKAAFADAVEDYLGKDYPLFYTHLSEVPVLLRNERLRAGYEHLRAMDKRDLTANTFVRRIYKFVNDIVLSSNFTG